MTYITAAMFGSDNQMQIMTRRYVKKKSTEYPREIINSVPPPQPLTVALFKN